MSVVQFDQNETTFAQAGIDPPLITLPDCEQCLIGLPWAFYRRRQQGNSPGGSRYLVIESY